MSKQKSFKVAKSTRALQLVASKDNTRYNIQSVFFSERKFAAATDGHILAIQDLAKTESKVEDNTLVTFASAKQKNPVETFFNLHSLVEDSEQKREINPDQFVSTSGGTADERSEGTFPDVTMVAPHELKQKATCSINMKLLLRLASALAEDGKLDNVTLQFDAENPTGPIFVKSNDESKLGLIMPVRTEFGDRDLLKEFKALTNENRVQKVSKGDK